MLVGRFYSIDYEWCKTGHLVQKQGLWHDCSSFSDIFLLSLTEKLFGRAILKWLQELAAKIYPKSQCGFRKGQSRIDMVSTLCLLQEKCIEQNKSLYIVFVNLRKEFSMSVTVRIGCTLKHLQMIHALHDGMFARVYFDIDPSEPFSLKCRVKQGCFMAPTLFRIYIPVLIHYSFPSLDSIVLCTWRDGKLFNLACMKAKTKTKTIFIHELMFPEDALFCAQTESKLQEMCDAFSASCDLVGLQISVQKTVMLVTNAPPPCIWINGQSLKIVDKFGYLGSIIDTSSNLITEVTVHVGKAASIFGKLQTQAWNNKYQISHNTYQSIDLWELCAVVCTAVRDGLPIP